MRLNSSDIKFPVSIVSILMLKILLSTLETLPGIPISFFFLLFYDRALFVDSMFPSSWASPMP